MNCPSCGANLKEDMKFCQNCGIAVATNNVESNDDIELLNTTKIGVIPEEKPKKKKSKLLLVIPILIIIGVVAFFVAKNVFKNNSNKKDNSSEQELTTLEKLQNDYDSGTLKVNDYFKQLVYYEYSMDDLDPKYKSDIKMLYASNGLPTYGILADYYEELDEDIIKFYLTNKFMANVELGEKTSSSKQNNKANSEYKVKRLQDASSAANHKLNKVYLSPNEKFLIWYADYGDDAITQEQLNTIAKGLDDCIGKYEQYFKIEYSYKSYVDNKLFNEDWKNAKEVLKQNDMPSSVLKTAMSVYVYDTGSDITLASYNDEEDKAKWINRSLYADILDGDGIINYPYIIINKRGFSGNIDSLVQLYNHELFHHMQRVYCDGKGAEFGCVTGEELSEGMANFASSEISSQVTSKKTFLSNWYEVYHKNTSTKLYDIVDGGGQVGYALFPYFHAYSQKVNNWQKTLMDAHATVKSFEYIQENTPKNELVDTINYLAFNTISKNYKNKAYYTSEDLVYKEDISNNKTYNLTINAGSIDYFKVPKNSELTITIPDDDFVTINLYGYESKKYNELNQYSKSVKINSNDFASDGLYLAITNGDLVKEYSYSIKVGKASGEQSGNSKNQEYNTSFNNYNVEIDIITKAGEMVIKSHSEGIIDELHQKEYLKSKTTTSGVMELNINTETYTDFVEGYSYTSNPYAEGSWLKDKQSSQMVDLKTILERLSSMKNVKTVSKDHFKVKMTKSELKELLVQSGNEDFELNDDVYVDVYTKNGYITKLDYDFTKAIGDIDKFTITIKFSNYDKAGDVEIPEKVIKNAK